MVGISLPSLSERDIDLLLLEELAARPTFVRWFARITRCSGLARQTSWRGAAPSHQVIGRV